MPASPFGIPLIARRWSATSPTSCATSVGQPRNYPDRVRAENGSGKTGTAEFADVELRMALARSCNTEFTLLNPALRVAAIPAGQPSFADPPGRRAPQDWGVPGRDRLNLLRQSDGGLPWCLPWEEQNTNSQNTNRPSRSASGSACCGRPHGH
jgi:hypothetical protein